MTFELINVTALDKSIPEIIFITLILLVRKWFNVTSIRYAAIILWTILFLHLLSPCSLRINIIYSESKGIEKCCFDAITFINEHKNFFIKIMGQVLSRINRLLVAILLSYVIYQILKMQNIIYNSSEIETDPRIQEYLDQFGLKCKIKILVNDNLKFPITYGLIYPKIIL